MSDAFEKNFTIEGEDKKSVNHQNESTNGFENIEGKTTPSISLEKIKANIVTDVDNNNIGQKGSKPQLEEILASANTVKPDQSPKIVKYQSKVSLEAATADDGTLVPKIRAEYVTAFKIGAEKTARSNLEMCRVVYEAKQCLDNYQFGEFCNEIGFNDYSSTIRKMVTIGKLYPRFIEYADQLPSSWTNIYLITQIPADVFEECIKKKFPLSQLTGSKLTELVNSTKDINRVEVPMSFDRPNGGYTIGKVLFTSMPDETDWRAMEKAFNELSARLPIKFVVNKKVEDIVQRRRDQRYKNSKKHYEHIELKPDLWDMGAEANAVYKAVEKVDSDTKAVITI